MVPIYRNGEPYGVIDIDSPILNRFGAVEKEEVEELADVLSRHI